MRQVTDAGWNFADAWERVAERIPNELAQRQGDREYTWSRVRPTRRRHRRHAARRWRRRAGQGRPLPLQLPRVPREQLRRVQGGTGDRQHQLPVRGRRARVPLEQRRRGGSRLPRHVRRAVRCRARSGAGCPAVAVGRRRVGAVPGVGGSVRSGRGVGDGARRSAVGSIGRSPVAALHRRHHRHAQGRDVAPGRSVRRPRREQPAPDAARTGPRRARRTGRGGGSPQPARRTVDARHRLLQRGEQPDVGWQRHDDGRAALRRRRAARHRRAVLDQLDVDRR